MSFAMPVLDFDGNCSNLASDHYLGYLWRRMVQQEHGVQLPRCPAISGLSAKLSSTREELDFLPDWHAASS